VSVFYFIFLLYIKKHKNFANDRNNFVTYSEKKTWPIRTAGLGY